MPLISVRTHQVPAAASELRSKRARRSAPGAPPARPRLLTLSQQIAEQLGKEIVDETHPPGERLKEVELAAHFGVSRASVREALRLLEARGLVKIESRRGVRVAALAADEVDELYEIRASLLSLAARRAALRRDEPFIAQAAALMQSLRQHAENASYSRYFDAAFALSRLIAEASGSPRLRDLISSFSHQVARYTRLSLRPPERRRRSLAKWQQLYAALQQHDGDAAERCMRELVFGSRDAVRELLLRESH